MVVQCCGRKKNIAQPTATDIHSRGWYMNKFFMASLLAA